MRNSAGFSLIEVLVSVVVLSVALLGTAGLMGASLKSTNTAYYRSQATVLADDIMDRMRANIVAARNHEYDVDLGPAFNAGAGAMARYDAVEWTTILAQTLPGGRGTVSVDGNEVATVTVQWDDGGNSFTFSTESHL